MNDIADLPKAPKVHTRVGARRERRSENPAAGGGGEEAGLVPRRPHASRSGQKRLAQYGPNEIAEKKTNELLKFLTYFWGPIPWMIEAAVILSAIARHWPDFGIILALLLANAVVGFWEEHQAGNAIAALKAKLAIKARVIRDGKWVEPAARELVPGDVIRLRLGDIVPADARLLDGDAIEVDQSALTGESLPAVVQARRGSVFRFYRPPGRNRRVWSTAPARTPISARPRNWCRAPIRSAISNAPC